VLLLPAFVTSSRTSHTTNPLLSFLQGEELATINPDSTEADGITFGDEEPEQPEEPEPELEAAGEAGSAQDADGEEASARQSNDASAADADAEGGEGGEEAGDGEEQQDPPEEDEETKARKAAAKAEAAAAAAQKAAANQRPLTERFPLRRKVSAGVNDLHVLCIISRRSCVNTCSFIGTSMHELRQKLTGVLVSEVIHFCYALTH
jgi:hypothetical protein